MSIKTFGQLFWIIFFITNSLQLFAEIERLRCMWRDDPTTTMVIGWDQVKDTNPILYYTSKNKGKNIEANGKTHLPDRVLVTKGMNNHYVRLSNLRPNTTYYFRIKDSGGSSRIYSFQTAPASPYSRLSIIAGGDSRNYRKARVDANKLVGKLRPHFVLFGGDMTASDVAEEWLDWFDDWQHTISNDGRLTPIVVARGNHEYSNKTLIDLFDVPTIDLFYAHTFGSDLLRIYTLNSLIPSGGKQRQWLLKDLQEHEHIQWKMAQYHHTIRPHTKLKPEKNDMLLNWASLFYEYQVKLVVESDAHVVKTTYPVKPSRSVGSSEGFIRDNEHGTVYIGEGCWGAPLRKNDDAKPWTRASGSFNQFKWIFIDREKIEIRTVKTDNVEEIGPVDPFNIFIPPLGLNIWEPETGAVVEITNDPFIVPAAFTRHLESELVSKGVDAMKIEEFEVKPAQKDMLVSWQVKNELPNYQYEVQRSFGIGRYQTVGKIRGKTTSDICDAQYSFIDDGLGITARERYIRYRIKYSSNQGKSAYYHPPIPKLEGEGLYEKKGKVKKIMTDTQHRLNVKYILQEHANVSYQVFDINRKEIFSSYLPNQVPKNYLKSLNLSDLPDGRYVLVIKANQEEIERYQVIKR